jgi:tetratricopeptide (TPR) repeat protein
VRCLFSASVSILVAMSVMVGGGCTTRQAPHTALRMGDYQKLLEKQKAGMSVADEVLQDLPEMTAEEYEMVGDNYFRQGNFSVAFVQYDKARRMAPARVSLRYKIGLVFLKKGLVEDALRAFQDILSTDDAFALAYEGIGQALLMRGDIRAAEQHFHRALALDGSLWKSHNALGMIYDHQGHFDEAIVSYKAAIALKSGNGALFNNLGLSYHRKGDYDNAIRVFLKALNMTDAKAKVYNNLGLSLAKLGRYREAFTAFTKGGDKARAYNNLGVIYLSEGKYEEATAAFEEAMALNSRYYTTANENLRIARQALGVSPFSPDVLANPSGERQAQPIR